MGKNFKTVRNWRPQKASKLLQQSFNIVDMSNILGRHVHNVKFVHLKSEVILFEALFFVAKTASVTDVFEIFDIVDNVETVDIVDTVEIIDIAEGQ